MWCDLPKPTYLPTELELKHELLIFRLALPGQHGEVWLSSAVAQTQILCPSL